MKHLAFPAILMVIFSYSVQSQAAFNVIEHLSVSNKKGDANEKGDVGE